MTKYATRTCHKCGAIHPQNEMHRATVESKSGESKKTLKFFDPNTTRQSDAFAGRGGRTYYRQREVFLCTKCNKKGNFWFLFFVVIALVWWFQNT